MIRGGGLDRIDRIDRIGRTETSPSMILLILQILSDCPSAEGAFAAILRAACGRILLLGSVMPRNHVWMKKKLLTAY